MLSVLNYVPCVPRVPLLLTCLQFFMCLTCLPFLRSFIFLRALRVLIILRPLRAFIFYMPYLPPLFKVFLSFDVPYELSPCYIKCGTTHSQSQLAGINKMMFQSLKRSGVLFSIKSN